MNLRISSLDLSGSILLRVLLIQDLLGEKTEHAS